MEEAGAVGVKEAAIMEDGRLGVAENLVGPVCCREGVSKKEKSADAQGSAAGDVTGAVVLVPALGVDMTVTGAGLDWNMDSTVFEAGVEPRVGVNVDTGALKSGKPPTVDFSTDGEDTISPQSSSLSSTAVVALMEDIPRSIGVTLKGLGAGRDGVNGRGAVMGGCPVEAGEPLFQLNVATGGNSRLAGRCGCCLRELTVMLPKGELPKWPNALGGWSGWTEEGRVGGVLFPKIASSVTGSAEESHPNMFFCVLDIPPPRETRPAMESSSIHRRTV